MQKLRSEIAADATVSSIQTDFAAFAEKSDRRRESEAKAMTKFHSVQRINEILREWSLDQSQLHGWDKALTKRSQILAAQDKDVARTIDIWRATQAAVAKKFLFKAVLQRRVEEVLAEAEGTRGILQEQTTKLLKLQSQIADSLTELAKTRKDIFGQTPAGHQRIFACFGIRAPCAGVQVGDSVEVGPLFGEVRKIRFRASVLRTPDGADVIVPNSELVGPRVVNWSLPDRLRRINISVGIAYGTDPHRVIEILLEIARKHPAVLAEPAPLAVFDRFADSALNLLCSLGPSSTIFVTRSDLTTAINNAFREAGIQIPFPQQDVHLHWSESRGSTSFPRQRRSNHDGRMGKGHT